jgi:hypothetical protein
LARLRSEQPAQDSFCGQKYSVPSSVRAKYRNHAPAVAISEKRLHGTLLNLQYVADRKVPSGTPTDIEL